MSFGLSDASVLQEGLSDLRVYGDALQDFSDLIYEELFSDVGMLGAITLPMSAAVVDVSLVGACRDLRPALGAVEEVSKHIGALLAPVTAPVREERVLYLVEQVTGDERLVRALEKLSLVAKEPGIERVLEHPIEDRHSELVP